MMGFLSADEALRWYCGLGRGSLSAARGQSLFDREGRRYDDRCKKPGCPSLFAEVTDGVVRCARCKADWGFQEARGLREPSGCAPRVGSFDQLQVRVFDLGTIFEGLDPEDHIVYVLHVWHQESYQSAAQLAEAAVRDRLCRLPEIPWTEKAARGAVSRCRQHIERELERLGWLVERPYVRARRSA